MDKKNLLYYLAERRPKAVVEALNGGKLPFDCAIAPLRAKENG
jgi:hypothetical protein